MEAKLALARWIVARSHGEDAARAAEEHFTRVVREGQAPADVPEATLPAGDPVHVPALLAECFGLSTSDARRLIAQGGVKVDGQVVGDLDLPTSDARRARSSRPESAVSCGLRADHASLERRRSIATKCATILQSPERVAQESCHSTNWSAFERTHTTSVEPPRGLCRESEVFCCHQQSGTVFENSTA